jgi:hypothetical protein
MQELQNEDIQLKTIVDGAEYFYMEVPDGKGKATRFVTKVPRGAGMRIPLQFGREIAAVAMGCGEKSHWKACVESEEAEKATAMAFRESFAAAQKS